MVHSSGRTGHNVEYVLKLAAWSRFALPEIIDHHLFDLEKHILSKVNDKLLYNYFSVLHYRFIVHELGGRIRTLPRCDMSSF